MDTASGKSDIGAFKGKAGSHREKINHRSEKENSKQKSKKQDPPVATMPTAGYFMGNSIIIELFDEFYQIFPIRFKWCLLQPFADCFPGLGMEKAFIGVFLHFQKTLKRNTEGHNISRQDLSG